MSASVSNHAVKAVQSAKTALVVDQVEEMLDLLEIALKCAGFSVIRASSVADAFALFEQNADSIDLLLTEVRVGGENGLELAKRLVQLKPSLQVLAISEFARDRKLVTTKTGIAFLPKPFSASELRKTLNALFPAVHTD
jgi:DNA-binding NtrC family response regulator